ncbi:sigma-54 dependent transcriptional regulator [Edaphobacter sp. 12200R-103]|uniref:sigma-54-dependent transcriptional regulator n=1 Tax=Edaphobacter sp. 12200R-103 TaxID=2703788 RepID=UPI00138B8CCF|nr:sigma 54-interacting transcriptional regulator [Edaphobacter sp. 12200R-103]QHS51306.1 sigma-54-dependent Fis family transcriptional regulator [Edaphobacter sp. 12200R-103]
MTIQGAYPADACGAFETANESPNAGPTYILAGGSAAMQRLRLQIERIGPHFRTVLLRGETGTGKHLVARALHASSRRAQASFSVWSGSRLDGSEHDATRASSLFVRAAKQGTVFLDRVDEMSPRAQKNLHAALTQENSLRTIAASRQDLRVMATAGLFRHDLYSGLSTVEIVLEPLRSRVEDIPELAGLFLGRFAQRYCKPIDAIAPEAMKMMLNHPWPGNVRELENVLHNGVLQCEGRMLLPGHLLCFMTGEKAFERWDTTRTVEPLRLQDVVDRHVLRVLQECSGNKVRAAEVLGISRSTLYRMLDTRAFEANTRQT